eukprot:INCI15283.1.p2 GENE.INCI15283.1~~INCI15283.1.p2  ORF type:complete len:113 (-),score=30.14 INCI15283.1:218-556(-)
MVDFKGQQLSEVIFQVVTISATVVGFFYGWYAQSFERTFQCWAVGVGVAVVLCVPDWWFYRKNPITWREPDYGDSDDEEEEDDEDDEDADEEEDDENKAKKGGKSKDSKKNK